MKECTTMWYTVKEGKLMLKYKCDGKFETVEAPFKPYFFVPKTKRRVAVYHMRRMKIFPEVEDTDLKTIDTEETVSKISVNVPKFVRDARDVLTIKDINSYEADIPYDRRVRIDLDWKTASNYKVAFFDIECWDAGRDYLRGYDQDQVICIAIVDDNGHEQVLYNKDECELLREFNKTAKQYDMLVGYNSDLFDVPRLKEREKLYRLRFPTKHVRWFDIMWMIRGTSQRELASWSLDYVTQTLLGEKILVHHDKRVHTLEDELIMERCLYDALALKMLNDEFQYVETAI
ncbi:hypothetical protein DRP04_15115, partial [Archaeoglobales archaeon]